VGVTTWGSGGDPPAAGNQRGFGGGAPVAAATFPAFLKNEAFSSTLMFKFLLKNVFMNDCIVC